MASLGLLALLLVGAACGSASTEGDGDGGTGGDGGGGGGTVPLPDIPALADPTPAPPYQPTTVENIEAAYAAGALTMEQRLLYEVQAIYLPAQVPAAYIGAPEPPTDHAYLFWLIAEQWASLSAATQTALLPFTLPPTDPASYFNPESPLHGLRDVVWEGQTLADGTTIQWPRDPARTDLPARVAAVAEAMTEVPPRFRTLLGLAVPRLDIYVMPAAEFSGAGEFGDAQPQANGCRVRIRDSIGGVAPTLTDEALKTTKATVAHELFHCFQFVILGGLSNEHDVRWLMESTATWSEDYAYPLFNTEQAMDSSYLYRMSWDLLDTRLNHHYGAYMWHFFLAQYSSPAEVNYALVQSRSPSSPGKMLAGRAGFAAEFGEFAVWSWNRDPFTYYRDPPPSTLFPTSADGDSRSLDTITAAGDLPMQVDLKKGGIHYYQVDLTNPAVGKLTFDLSRLGATPGGTTAVTALLYFDTGTFREDWSGQDKVVFCRTVPDQNLGRAILVVSNADLSHDASGVITIRAEEKCGPGWHGGFRVRWRRDDLWTGAGGMMTWQNTENHLGDAAVREQLVYDPVVDGFVVKEMTFSSRTDDRDGRVKVRDDSGLCGTISEMHRTTTWGGAAFTFPEQDPDGTHTRLYGANSGTGRYGGTYGLSFDLFVPAGAASPFRGTSVTRIVPAAYDTFVGIACNEHIAEVESDVTDPSFPSLTGKDVAIATTDTTIQGTTSYELFSAFQGPVSVTIDWHYRKVQ
jgi:hypothetical protein